MTESHQKYMRRALELAQLGLYTTDPNPRVGCVIVKDGHIIGEGFHEKAGEPHAEIHALRQAGEQAKDATVYVTLEPCCHQGKTPPCCDALIHAGVKEVWAAMADPNPQVNGGGIARLKEAGIQTDLGVLEAEAVLLNPGYIKRMTQGLPWVRVKMAMSVDGRTAMESGESQWITGSGARQDVQRLRARSSAVITSVDTVLQDDPSLTVRTQEWHPPYPLPIEVKDNEQIASSLQPSLAGQLVRQPLRVMLDTHLRANFAYKIFHQPGRALWVATRTTKNLARMRILEAELEDEPVEWLLLEDMDEEHRVDLRRLLEHLASIGCNEVLVEAGSTLAAAFIQQQCVDELWLYMAPKLLGSSAQPLVQWSLEKLSEAVVLQLKDITLFGDDVRLVYRASLA